MPGETIGYLSRYNLLPVRVHVYPIGGVYPEDGLQRMIDVDDLPAIFAGGFCETGDQASEPLVTSGVFGFGFPVVHRRRGNEDAERF